MEKGVKDESAQIQVDISHLTLGQISENFVKEIGNRGAQQQGKEFLKEIVQSLVENAGRVESALKISSECSTSDSGNVTFQLPKPTVFLTAIFPLSDWNSKTRLTATETEPPQNSECQVLNDPEDKEREIERLKNEVQASGNAKINTNYPDDTEFIQCSNFRVLKPSNSPVNFDWSEFGDDSLKVPSPKSSGQKNQPPTATPAPDNLKVSSPKSNDNQNKLATATPAPKVTSGRLRNSVKDHVVGDPSRKATIIKREKKRNQQNRRAKPRGRPAKKYEEFPEIDDACVLDKSEEKVAKLEKYLKMATKRSKKENTKESTCSFPVTPTNGGVSTLCGSKFPNIHELKRHLSRKHLEMEKWICKRCVNKNGENYLKYKAKDALVSHLRTHHSDYLKTCECGWPSKSYRSFYNHAQKCKKNRKGNPEAKKNRNGNRRRNIKD